MSKKGELSKSKKIKLIVILAIGVIGVTVIISLYNQNLSDKKEQMVILQQKENDKKIANEKQEEVDKVIEEKKVEEEQKALEQQKILEKEKVLEEQKKLEEQKVLEEQKKLEEQKVLEEQKKIDEERALKEVAGGDTSQVSTAKPVFTKEKAIEIVNKIVVSKNPKVKIAYDHTQKREGKDYYVIRIYEDMDDHISTLGWYYVQVDTEKIFEWNLVEDTLKLVNQ